jgi:cardiolipin synthase
VGSANFDNRSFQLNDEAVLAVQDHGFARALTESFTADIGVSDEVTHDAWRRRPVTERAREVGSRVLRREL